MLNVLNTYMMSETIRKKMKSFIRAHILYTIILYNLQHILLRQNISLIRPPPPHIINSLHCWLALPESTCLYYQNLLQSIALPIPECLWNINSYSSSRSQMPKSQNLVTSHCLQSCILQHLQALLNDKNYTYIIFYTVLNLSSLTMLHKESCQEQ